jgi:hypothetical protein
MQPLQLGLLLLLQLFLQLLPALLRLVWLLLTALVHQWQQQLLLLHHCPAQQAQVLQPSHQQQLLLLLLLPAVPAPVSLLLPVALQAQALQLLSMQKRQLAVL